MHIEKQRSARVEMDFTKIIQDVRNKGGGRDQLPTPPPLQSSGGFRSVSILLLRGGLLGLLVFVCVFCVCVILGNLCVFFVFFPRKKTLDSQS